MKTMFTDYRKHMKTAVVACCLALAALLLTTLGAQAQGGVSYNPYLVQGIISPAPLLPVEFGGTGVAAFDVGNTGSTDMLLVPNQEMKLVITLSKGVPNVSNPSDPVAALAALGGDGVEWFEWTYDPAITTYRATQKVTIPGSTPTVPSRRTVTIQYRVTQNSFLGGTPSISNGFNANLQPPPYVNPQPTDDDAVSSYTYVEAKDYGDAPTAGTAPNGIGTNAYGSAVSAIDVSKDGNGYYNRYMYMGASVDPEGANQASAAADGDDVNQTNLLAPSDDENGVTFTSLSLGATVTIPVVVTIVDADQTFPTGVLNAWIDWNGDGDWADPGEKIANAISVSSSGTVNLTVTVPADAITAAPTYARFRFGNGASTTSSAPYGEVEDFKVTISDPTAVTLRELVARPAGTLQVWDGLQAVLQNLLAR
jgi:hypothetical protein